MPAPVRLQPGGVAAAVAAPANRPALALRPFARSHPSASAPRCANPGAHLRPRRARAAGAAAVRQRLWALAAHGARIAGGSARAHPRSARRLLRPRAHRLAQHAGHRSGGRTGRAHFAESRRFGRRSLRARRPDHQARNSRPDAVGAGAAARRAALGRGRRLRIGGHRMDAGGCVLECHRHRAARRSCRAHQDAMPPPAAFRICSSIEGCGARGLRGTGRRRMPYSSAAERPCPESSMPRERHCAPWAGWSSTP